MGQTFSVLRMSVGNGTTLLSCLHILRLIWCIRPRYPDCTYRLAANLCMFYPSSCPLPTYLHTHHL